MDGATTRSQFGVDADGGFFVSFIDGKGNKAYLTVDLPCHILLMMADGTTKHGDSVTPYEAFYMLTGKRAEDVLDVPSHDSD